MTNKNTTPPRTEKKLKLNALMIQIKQCKKEVASWPVWMRQTTLAPTWMLGWDD